MTELDVIEGEIVSERTPDQWAALVRSDLGQAVAGFIAAGQHLREAKVQIPHGGWESWVKDQVGISPQKANMLMQLSAHEALANPYHGRDLPPSWRTLYELSQLDPPLLEAAPASGKIHPEMERKQARALVIEYKQAAAQVRFDVRHCDFRDLDPDYGETPLEAGTVDAIITDAPYPAEFMPLLGRLPKTYDEYGSAVYDEMDESGLSEIAERLLKPGGICAVMMGQSYLPEVMTRLSRRLTYHWTLAYLTPGGQAVQVFPRKINTFWKPVLVFTNGDSNTEWFGDVAKSDVNDNDKRFHHWGQSESGMADLVKRLTRPGALILDPFMGAGTTGVAAIALGRSFIGCDVNADHVQAARERLEATVLERLGS